MGMRIRFLILTFALGLSACRARTVSEQPAEPTPEVEAAEGSAEVEEPESLVGANPPEIRLAEQACGAHADCRVIQPGDWNPRVECCYEYSCDLDYVAINQDTWALVRAWQRANSFDCAQNLQQEGPCSSRSQPCGLVQDSPAAVCDEGLCRVQLADPWPVVDPEKQRCTAALDCVPYATHSGSFESRCCGVTCETDWIAVTRQTAGEIDRWRNYHATPCEVLMESESCPRLEHCDSVAPSVTCEGGQCVVGE